MKRCFITLVLVWVAVTAAFGQTAQSDEQIIRSIVKRSETEPSALKSTKDRIFVSGLYPRPFIGQPSEEDQKIAETRRGDRKNEKTRVEIIRLVVSGSKDVAYEFSNSYHSYDKDGEKVNSERSYLRCWRKINGEWLVDAFFARPNDPISGGEKK
jgi:ketosteroid isomerase-like protein